MPLRAAADRCLVLEPRPHAGVGDRVGNSRGRDLRGVVFDVQPLSDDVGREALEAGDVFEAPLEHGHFFAAVHPFDLEGRLGVQFTDSAGHLLVVEIADCRFQIADW